MVQVSNEVLKMQCLQVKTKGEVFAKSLTTSDIEVIEGIFDVQERRPDQNIIIVEVNGHAFYVSQDSVEVLH